MSFENFVKDISENSWNVHGVEVYKDGVLKDSWGNTTEELYPIYSCTKSILSVALGIAIDRGYIGVDKCILNYLPVRGNGQLEGVSVRRLMCMSVKGFPFRPEGENYLEFSLNQNLVSPAKKIFEYSNIAPYLVGVALNEALLKSCGVELGKFIETEVFAPLNIDNYEYSRSPEGYFYPASQMFLTVHDLSKIGLLMCNGGVFEGKRILSEDYVKEATSVQIETKEGGYGYFFWKYKDGFSINGKFKQKCYCLPSKNMVITYLADIRDDSHDLVLSMERNILNQ